MSAWNYLVHVQRIAPRGIAIYGHSLGAAIAVELALIESPFTSMTDMGRLEYPWIPVDLILNQRFDVLSKMGQLEVPVVLVHAARIAKCPS